VRYEVIKRLYERDRILDGQWKYLHERCKQFLSYTARFSHLGSIPESDENWMKPVRIQKWVFYRNLLNKNTVIHVNAQDYKSSGGKCVVQRVLVERLQQFVIK
jgi:hypothetical protein